MASKKVVNKFNLKKSSLSSVDVRRQVVMFLVLTLLCVFALVGAWYLSNRKVGDLNVDASLGKIVNCSTGFDVMVCNKGRGVVYADVYQAKPSYKSSVTVKDTLTRDVVVDYYWGWSGGLRPEDQQPNEEHDVILTVNGTEVGRGKCRDYGDYPAYKDPITGGGSWEKCGSIKVAWKPEWTKIDVEIRWNSANKATPGSHWGAAVVNWCGEEGLPLIGQLPTPTSGPVQPTLSPTSPIRIEAENAGALTPGMRVITDTLASGGKALQVSPDDTALATYSVQITGDATYHLWVRTMSADSGSNSFFYSWNNGPAVEYGTGSVYNSWVWGRVGSSSLKKGENVLRIWRREPNLKIDRVSVTQSSTTW